MGSLYLSLESGFFCFTALPDGLVPHLRPASVSFPPRSPGERTELEAADEVWVFGETISEGMAAEIKRAHELKKPVCNLPEPGRMVELLLKRLSEQYHIPMEDKTEEQQEAAESEEDNGE